MTIFDYLTILHNKSKKWNDLSEQEQKDFNQYMLNRWLSMDMEYCEFINELQQYTIGILDKKSTFILYQEILPYKKKFFVKYIKGKKEGKYNPELISILKDYYEESKRNIINILDLIFINNEQHIIKSILEKYGKTDRQIKTLIKIKK